MPRHPQTSSSPAHGRTPGRFLVAAVALVTCGSAEPALRTTPTGGGGAVELEPVPAASSSRTWRRPIYVCAWAEAVEFADRPCSPAARVHELRLRMPVDAPDGAVASVTPPEPAASTRPARAAARDPATTEAPAGASQHVAAQIGGDDQRWRLDPAQRPLHQQAGPGRDIEQPRAGRAVDRSPGEADLVGDRGPPEEPAGQAHVEVVERRDDRPLIGRCSAPTAHQASQRLSDSITQAGLLLPSTSMVMVIVVWTPPAISSTAVISAPARMRLPTGTGAGNRTRPVP